MSISHESAVPAQALKRALTTIGRMQQRLDEFERDRAEPIAIVGMSCKFPGGVNGPESYWDLLQGGGDGIVEVPADRWDVDEFFDERSQTPGKISSRWGGFLDRIDRFDHEFFNISRREAALMDPQQRLFLEGSWEALEDAGLAPESLAGSETGVYLAVYGIEYASQVFADLEQINAYSALGNLHSIAAGRVSYLLDLRGPSVAVDAACSSSLVAVHQACQGLRLGETDMAICGAVNTLLSPHASVSLSQLNESFVGDGRVKAFDAAADGFVRSEGCGVVVLKRLSDARRDGDLVYAVIRGSAVNQDGRGAGMTAPNGAAQRTLVHRALRVSGVRPEQVAFVETHGTGTKLGDPIEVDALADVYGRPEGLRLYLGAVKTNLGHLEAAAGMAGLIKAALCVQRGQIPPNLHFTELSPHISFEGTTFAIPTEVTPWPPQAQSRLAGVSSFGLNGTNAHLIIEQDLAAERAQPDLRRPCSVLPLSARSETALVKLARRYHDRLGAGSADLADVSFSASTGRTHFPFRLAVVGKSVTEVAQSLADFVRGEPGPGLVHGHATGIRRGDVVFLFSGAGSQREGMARELYATQPTFRRVLDRCDEILRPALGRPLLSYLDQQEPGVDRMDQVEHAVPALFALEYALAEMWRSWGIEPAAVIGHSIGEYAAATFAGVMSLEDGLRLVTERARLLHQLPDEGAMAAISTSRERVAAALAAQDPTTISIAAVNGPSSVTVSGRREVVAAVCTSFASSGVEVKPLRVPRSGHSPLVEPVLAPLEEVLRTVRFAPPQIPLVSNVTGEMWPWDQAPDADYWLRHTREPVLFADGIATLADLGYRTYLEIGPGTDMLGMALATLPPDGDVLMLPSLRPRRPDWDVLLSTVSRLYVLGADLDWAAFDRDYQRTRVRLPSYPFESVRCWHDIVPGALLAPSRPADELDLAAQRSIDARGTARGSSPTGTPAGLMTAADLLAMDPPGRVDALVAQLVRIVKDELGYRSATIDPDEPLSNVGLDSLMAVELRNEIQIQLGVSLTVASFLRGATIRSVAQAVVTKITAGPADGDVELTGAGGSSSIRRVERAEDAAAELLRQIEELADEQGAPAAAGERTYE